MEPSLEPRLQPAPGPQLGLELLDPQLDPQLEPQLELDTFLSILRAEGGVALVCAEDVSRAAAVLRQEGEAEFGAAFVVSTETNKVHAGDAVVVVDVHADADYAQTLARDQDRIVLVQFDARADVPGYPSRALRRLLRRCVVVTADTALQDLCLCVAMLAMPADDQHTLRVFEHALAAVHNMVGSWAAKPTLRNGMYVLDFTAFCQGFACPACAACGVGPGDTPETALQICRSWWRRMWCGWSTWCGWCAVDESSPFLKNPTRVADAMHRLQRSRVILAASFVVADSDGEACLYFCEDSHTGSVHVLMADAPEDGVVSGVPAAFPEAQAAIQCFRQFSKAWGCGDDMEQMFFAYLGGSVAHAGAQTERGQRVMRWALEWGMLDRGTSSHTVDLRVTLHPEDFALAEFEHEIRVACKPPSES